MFSSVWYQGGRPCLSCEANIDGRNPFKHRQAQGLETFIRKEFIYGSCSIDRVTLMKMLNLRALPPTRSISHCTFCCLRYAFFISVHFPFIMYCLHTILDAISQGCSSKSKWSIIIRVSGVTVDSSVQIKWCLSLYQLRVDQIVLVYISLIQYPGSCWIFSGTFKGFIHPC